MAKMHFAHVTKLASTPASALIARDILQTPRSDFGIFVS